MNLGSSPNEKSLNGFFARVFGEKEVILSGGEKERIMQMVTGNPGVAQTGRQRIQLEFTPEAMERLRQIRGLANASTNAEVVRNALRIYEWFLRQKAEDYRFQLIKEDQVREVELVL